MTIDDNTNNASSTGRTRRFAAVKIQLSSTLPNDIRQGIEYVRRWLQDSPDDQEIYTFLINTLREIPTLQNTIMELFREMNQRGSRIAAITLSELTANVQNLMAEADDAYYVREFDKAIILYKKVLQLEPNNHQAWNRLVKAEANKIDGIGSEKLPREAIRWFRQARSYIAAKDLRMAIVHLNAAIEEARDQGISFSDAEELLKSIQNLSASKDKANADITIFLEGNINNFNSPEQNEFVIDLSKILQIDSNQIKILRIREGSVVITLDMPEESVRELLSLFLEKDSRLKDLKIEKLYLEQPITNPEPNQTSNKTTFSNVSRDIGIPSQTKQAFVPKIFISYSHTDEKYKNELAKMLIPLEDQGLLEIWQDRKIVIGDEWYQAIREAMNTCDLALLLVSGDFLTSDFIRNEELTRLLQRRKEEGLRLVPIIIRPCKWQSVPVLKDLQALPKDGKPVVSFEGAGKRDWVWTQIATSIENLL